MAELIKINEICEDETSIIEQMEQDERELHMPSSPVTFLQLDVHNPEGEHVLEYKLRSKSFVRNWYNILLSSMLSLAGNLGGSTFGEGTLSLKQVGGTVIGNASYQHAMGVSAQTTGISGSGLTGTAGITTQGIVVGTGSTAESFEDYKLATLTLNGITSGTLSYAAQSATSASYNAGTKKWTVTFVRVINNSSGGSITVTEVGLHCKVYTAGSGWNAMVARDLLATPVVLANGGALTVTYTMELVFPG